MAGCGIRRMRQPWQGEGFAKPLPKAGSSSSAALGEAADAPSMQGTHNSRSQSTPGIFHLTSTPEHPGDFPFPSTAVNPALGTNRAPHKPPPSASCNPR